MKVYGGILSPFVMRVVLVARAKGHELQAEMPEGGIKSEAYMRLNPMGKMPTFADGDWTLPESLVIAEYLDETLPGPSIIGTEARERAHVRLLAMTADQYVGGNMQPIFAARNNPDGVPAAVQKLAQGLNALEKLRDAGHSHAAANRFTLADAVIVPLFFFLDAMPVPGLKELIGAHPGLAAYWERVKADPLAARALAEQEAGLKAVLGR